MARNMIYRPRQNSLTRSEAAIPRQPPKEAAEAAWLLDQPRKECRLHRNEQCNHDAESQTHNRAGSYSAPKHLLFTVCQFTSPKATVTLLLPHGERP